MRMKIRSCRLIQKGIAWGRGLSPEDKEHIRGCKDCSEMAVRIEELDLLFDRESDINIREGFADRVGAGITFCCIVKRHRNFWLGTVDHRIGDPDGHQLPTLHVGLAEVRMQGSI